MTRHCGIIAMPVYCKLARATFTKLRDGPVELYAAYIPS
jgi:hypothetical protein